MVYIVDANGMGEDSVAYEVSGGQTAGTKKDDGTAPTPTDPVLRIAKITPTLVTTLSYISRNIQRTTPLNYQSRVSDGALNALRKKTGGLIVTGDPAAAIPELTGILKAAAIETGSDVEIDKIDATTLRKIALAYGGADNVEGGGVLLLNKDDLIAFGDIRGTNEKKAVYEIEFSENSTTTGTIKDGGLAVRFCIVSELKSLSSGKTPAAAGDYCMTYGKPLSYQLDLFGPYTVELGLFNELDGSAKTSIDNLIETLQGQVSYMETYAANIQKAMELGVDEGLIKKLSDGSEESAQILAAIVEGGEEDIAALNEQLAKVEEGKEAFSETVAEMEINFSEKMKDIEDRVKEMADELDASAEAQAAGMATIDGYIDGAESMRSSLVSTYQSLANAANNAYKSTLEIHSPSRVFKEDGKNTIRGAIEGAEEEGPNLERTYSALAESANRAYLKSRPTGSEEGLLAGQQAQTAAIVAALQNGGGASGGIAIYVDKLEVRDDSDAERVARELYYLTEQKKRSRGGGSL